MKADEQVHFIHERLNGEARHNRREWTVPVIYTDVDGREVPSNHTGMSKTDALELLDTLPRTIDLYIDQDLVDYQLEQLKL